MMIANKLPDGRQQSGDEMLPQAVLGEHVPTPIGLPPKDVGEVLLGHFGTLPVANHIFMGIYNAFICRIRL